MIFASKITRHFEFIEREDVLNKILKTGLTTDLDYKQKLQ